MEINLWVDEYWTMLMRTIRLPNNTKIEELLPLIHAKSLGKLFIENKYGIFPDNKVSGFVHKGPFKDEHDYRIESNNIYKTKKIMRKENLNQYLKVRLKN